MTAPPRLAKWMVRTACPERDVEYVVGDLDAEFALRGGERRWYWRQALRSVGALAMMGMRRNDWEYALLAVFVASAAPAVLMEAWWSFMLSNVPLKADAMRHGDFAGISLGLTAVLAMCAGTVCTRWGLRLAIPAAWGFVLLGQAAVHNIVPWWFCGASLATVGLALTAGAWVRHLIDKPNGGGTFA
ncbi:MAG: hypothetical protein JWP63_6422 [Candidatus Solibacter sp.]|nr:hypothetical protein [Candidatus Solibacter sp.]